MPASCRSGTSRTTLQLAADLEQSAARRAAARIPRRDVRQRAARWSDSLDGVERLRFTLNTLTRIRFVTADGTLEFATKDGADAAPPGFPAWFDAPGRRTAGMPIAFGHWSALGLLDRPDVLGLDTGCVWGGRLTAVRIDTDGREVFHVGCTSARNPPKRRAGAARH